MSKLFYISEDYVPKGKIKGFPLEVVDRMIHEQVKQGNPADVGAFEKDNLRGFDWHRTEDKVMWRDIYFGKTFLPFKEKYADAHITQEEFDEVNGCGASIYISELPEVHEQINYENGTITTTTKHPNGVIESVTQKLSNEAMLAKESAKKAQQAKEDLERKLNKDIKQAFDNIPEDAKLRVEKRVENYDYINPDHYNSFDKEAWEMMVDIWGVEKFTAHCEMSAFKYRMRLGSKPDQPIERDLKKAKWYEDKARELKQKNE